MYTIGAYIDIGGETPVRRVILKRATACRTGSLINLAYIVARM